MTTNDSYFFQNIHDTQQSLLYCRLFHRTTQYELLCVRATGSLECGITCEFDVRPEHEHKKLAKVVYKEDKDPYIELNLDLEGQKRTVQTDLIRWPERSDLGNKYDWTFPHIESPCLTSNSQ